MLRIGLVIMLLLTFSAANSFAQRPFTKQPPKKKSDFFYKDERPDAPLLVFDIYEVQASLNVLGFNVGTPDGELSPKTQAALVQFQQATGVTAQPPLTRQFLLDLRKQLQARLPDMQAQAKTPDTATLRRIWTGKTVFLHYHSASVPRYERLIRYHAPDGRVYQYVPLEGLSMNYAYRFEDGTICLRSDRGNEVCPGIRQYHNTMMFLARDGSVSGIYSIVKEGDVANVVAFHAEQLRIGKENMAQMMAMLRASWEMVMAEERAKARRFPEEQKRWEKIIYLERRKSGLE